MMSECAKGFRPSSIARWSRAESESMVTNTSASGSRAHPAACACFFPAFACRTQVKRVAADCCRSQRARTAV